eukprot:CAMPEP_0180159742 /NCGR_PEP_ID=MMETSP0986-20121125/27700_1 /TAXON_ID=697907 /ORGANISM="non described non described, Strain CCMP2293" /LENGTH=149 /DNA_ID=CAMNT_0022109875 /DNA_START=118 /DNA_END=564 /DNA_ORIENTATION=-
MAGQIARRSLSARSSERALSPRALSPRALPVSNLRSAFLKAGGGRSPPGLGEPEETFGVGGAIDRQRGTSTRAEQLPRQTIPTHRGQGMGKERGSDLQRHTDVLFPAAPHRAARQPALPHALLPFSPPHRHLDSRASSACTVAMSSRDP